MKCKYCLKEIDDDAKKCHYCGEMQSIFSPLSRVIPVLSVLITVISLMSTWINIEKRQEAELIKDQVSQELEVQQVAAENIVRDVVSRLDATELRQFKRSLQITPGLTPERVQLEVKQNPMDVQLQQKSILLKALK